MSGLFSRPKSVKPPPIPPVEETEEPEEVAKKKAGRRRGYRRTIITGALTPETGKKQLLGGKYA